MSNDKQVFSALEYAILHAIGFGPKNPGYKPEVKESPNADGKIDYDKRYCHIARKYIKNMPLGAQQEQHVFEQALSKCQQIALQVAIELGIPEPFWPDLQDSTLRILEYNDKAGAEPHIDGPCLFTVMAYRNLPEFFEYVYDEENDYKQVAVDLDRARRLNTQIHFGGLMPILVPGSRATKHRVKPTAKEGVWQYSAVYFAMPKLSAKLPDGRTVGQYVDEIKSKMRYT